MYEKSIYKYDSITIRVGFYLLGIVDYGLGDVWDHKYFLAWLWVCHTIGYKVINLLDYFPLILQPNPSHYISSLKKKINKYRHILKLKNNKIEKNNMIKNTMI